MASSASDPTFNKTPSRESVAASVSHYFIQLTEGCHQPDCDNRDCATGSGHKLDPNSAAARAVILARKSAHLCVDHSVHSLPNSKAPLKELTRNHSSNHTRPGKVGSAASNDNHVLSSSVATMSLSASPPPSDLPPASLSPHSQSSLLPNHGSTTSSPAELPAEEPMDMGDLRLHQSTSDTSLLPASSHSLTLLSEKDELSTESEIRVANSPKKPRREDATPARPSSAQDDPLALTEEKIEELIAKAMTLGGNFKELTSILWNVFSSPNVLNHCFLFPEESMEDLPPVHAKTKITVDVSSVRRVYDILFQLEQEAITNNLANVMDVYCTAVRQQASLSNSSSLNHVVILFENPLLHSPEFLERASPKFLQVVGLLSLEQKAVLVEWFSSYSVEDLQRLISTLQQIILIRLLAEDDSTRTFSPHSDRGIAGATHALMILNVSNLVMARRLGHFRPHSKELRSKLANPIPSFLHKDTFTDFEKLLVRFGVHPAEAVNLPIPLEEFINEELNKSVNILTDFKRQGEKALMDDTRLFCFFDHPFILNPANKVEKLFFENQLSMINERHRSLVHTVLTGIRDLPFLLLRVDRHDLISETLVQLETIADLNPADFRKQLRVEFKDEDGIDEGGVQKEFFQLLIERLFDAMNGMFSLDEEQQHYWFNQSSLESEDQYRLIGILLGLAIYNNVILDVHFPMVVYHKLIGCNTVFNDLFSSHPQIAMGLQSILEYEDSQSNFEEKFMLNFSVSYTDMFGNLQTVCLKKGGESIPVTVENRQEYVDLYVDWLLNKSIAKQFDAFKKGFDLVMGDSGLADLFTAEEVELLVCGCKEWDFSHLKDNTRYDGFTSADPVIKYFWEVFDEFSEEEKKQLLAFVTGSDRVPVGGLCKVNMIIVKNGPDSDRLPTAHTCFNALLLCEYSTKEKLKERLMKAFSHGKGFGMF